MKVTKVQKALVCVSDKREFIHESERQTDE